MKKQTSKNWGVVLQVNQGRDKKTGKVIRFSMPVATTAKSKAEAIRNMRPHLERMRKMKGVTKSFGINPKELKRISKKEFISKY